MSQQTPVSTIRLGMESEAGLISYLRMVSLLCLEMPGESLATIRHFMCALPDVDTPLLRSGAYYLADRGGELIGGAGWSPAPSLWMMPNLFDDAGHPVELTIKPGSALVRGFFLDPDMGRRGLGATLLSHIEASVQKAGYSSAEIVVPASAQLYYRGLGFRTVGKLFTMAGRRADLALLQMRKALCVRLELAA